MDLKLRRFATADIPCLRAVFELCFGRTISEDYFRWKYLENPSGEVVAFVALDGETIAAFYGVIPEIYLINGKPNKIFQSMDTMTHPGYQRRGLFVKLAQMTYAQVAKDEGELKLVGIGGPGSYSGFVNKLQWHGIRQTRYVFTSRLLHESFSLLRRSRRLDFSRLEKMDQDLSAFLAARELSDKPIQPEISARFFDWRVFKNRARDFRVIRISERGKMIGICAYTLAEKGRVFIHFLSFKDAELYEDGTASIISHLFAETGASFVFTWEATNDSLRRALSKSGFLSNPLPKGPFSYRIPVMVRAEPQFSDGVNWYDIGSFDVQPLMQD